MRYWNCSAEECKGAEIPSNFVYLHRKTHKEKGEEVTFTEVCRHPVMLKTAFGLRCPECGHEKRE